MSRSPSEQDSKTIATDRRAMPAGYLPAVAVVVAVLMVLVLAGWILGIGELTGGFAVLEGTVMPNAALAILALSSAWLLRLVDGPRRMIAARLLAVSAGIVGAATVFEYWSGLNLRIDEFFIPTSRMFQGVALPGRMAPELALGIALLSVAFLLTSRRIKQVVHTLTAGGCGLVVLAIAAESLILFAGPEWVEGWLLPDYRMSDLSAVCLAILGIVSFGTEWRTRAHTWSIDLLNTLALAVVAVLLSAAGLKLASMSAETVVANHATANFQAAREELLHLKFTAAIARHDAESLKAAGDATGSGELRAATAAMREARSAVVWRAREVLEVSESIGEVPVLSERIVDRLDAIAKGGATPWDRDRVARIDWKVFDEATDGARNLLSRAAGGIAAKQEERAMRSRWILFGGAAGSLLMILFAVLRLNRAEIARRRSDDDLARAQAVAAIGHWRIDLVGNNSEVSAETKRIYGLKDTVQMTHENFLSCLHPDDVDWVEEEWRKALAGGVYDVEYRIVVNGKIRWVHELGDVVCGPSGTPVSGVGIVRDITSEREDAQALTRMAMVIRETPDMFVVCDVNLKVTGVNRSVAKHFGGNLESTPGELDLRSVFTEEEFEQLAAVSLPEAERSGTWSGRSMIRGKKGERVPVSMLVLAHKGRKGMVDEFSFVICDISAEVAAEEADRALREEQRSRASLLSALPGMAYRCLNDEAWTLEFVSPGCFELTGFPAEDLVGDAKVSFGALIHSDDRKQVLDRVWAGVKERRPFEIIYRIHAKDGSEKWVWERGVGVFADDGTLIALEGFIADITERRLAEVRVAASERKFAALFRSSPVAMSITRLSDNKITEVNASFERLTGHKQADVAGRSVFEIGLVHDHAKRDRFITQLRAEGRIPLTESFVFDRDGNRHTTFFTADLVTFGGEEHAIVSTIDITGQRRAEERVRLQASAIDAAANAIAITDREGRVLVANPAFAQLTGIPVATAVGEETRIFDAGVNDREFFNNLWTTVLGGNVWHGEVTNRRADGTRYVAEQTITPVQGEKGEVKFLIVIAQDVTDVRRREEEVLRAERLSSVGRLAGGIAHDLNNILAPMMMVPALLRPAVNDAESLRMLDFIETNARRGASIIKQLLTFSRGISGPRRAIVPTAIVAEVEAIMRETFPKNIETQVIDRIGDVTVEVDQTQIHQVLMNLCVNARDAMPNGGCLTISTEIVEVGREMIGANPRATPGPHVLLTVSDTGVGIPPEILDRIYDPFFTTKPVGEGTGLGLSTSLGIVRSHGGMLTVSSEVGRGTRFELLLPVSGLGVENEEPAEETTGDRGCGERLLLVEDEDNARRTLRAFLERGGYRVVEAKNGADALQIFRGQPQAIDAIVSDTSMPVMDGVEFIRHVRLVRKAVPIILCSGSLGGTSSALVGKDADYFLAKPYMPADLMKALRLVLTR